MTRLFLRLLCLAILLQSASSTPAQAPGSDTSSKAAQSKENTPSTLRFDVAVYGATPAGVFAAVGAAREGASVVLVEPSHVIGGMVASGLCFSDSNQCDRRTLQGLFDEFYVRCQQYYHKKGVKLTYDVHVKDDFKPWLVEPHVAELIFRGMLKEAGVAVVEKQTLKSLAKKNSQIVSFTTDRGNQIIAEQFLDATYEGDLMARAGVSYVVGRESRAKYQESLAGEQYPKRTIQVNPFDEQGNLLPLMTGPGPANRESDHGDKRVMTYSFRITTTRDPQNRVPFPQPKKYDPAQYELVRRYLVKYPKTRTLIDHYPDVPGNKIDLNNSIGGQISLGLVGASDAWPEATPQQREKIYLQHKEYTLGLIHFIKTDPVVPQAIRNRYQDLGLAKDEFPQTGHWPPILYIREGRRMVGAHVLTQQDIRKNIHKEDAVVVSSFPIDSHDCQRIPTSDGKGFVNEGTIFPRRIYRHGRPYQVPYRCLTPQRNECTNLLVPVCLSSSHVAMSSIRVEPTWMVLGQSAGVAAALAAKENCAVQDLDYRSLRKRLIAQKQALEILPPIKR